MLPPLPSVGNVEAKICDGKDENWYVNFCVSPCRKIVVFCRTKGKNLLSDKSERLKLLVQEEVPERGVVSVMAW